MTYEELEQALKSGKTVERCSIDENGNAVSWSAVDSISKEWDVSRYRIN